MYSPDTNSHKLLTVNRFISGLKLYHGDKYFMSDVLINAYTWQMNLTIKNLQKSDFGAYVCSSNNAIGKSDARIRLQGNEFLCLSICVIETKNYKLFRASTSPQTTNDNTNTVRSYHAKDSPKATQFKVKSREC